MRAIILAAGKGMRMDHHTMEKPKSMVDVQGKPILVRTLENMHNAGIKEVIILTGYHEHIIKEAIKDKFQDIDIKYVTNEKYAETNNIYSLYLAKEFLKGDVIITAGDILTKPEVIKSVVQDKTPSIGVISPFREELNGTCVQVNGCYIEKLFLKKDQDENFDRSEKFKTVNIFKFCQDFLENTFNPELEKHIQENKVNDFYEIVLQSLFTNFDHNIFAHIIEKEDWTEVDTPQELKEAEEIVAKW